MTYGFRYLRSKQINIPRGFIQDDLGVKQLISTCSFQALDDSDQNVAQPLWSVSVEPSEVQSNGQYRISRVLYINGIKHIESFETTYQ